MLGLWFGRIVFGSAVAATGVLPRGKIGGRQLRDIGGKMLKPSTGRRQGWQDKGRGRWPANEDEG